MFRFKVKFIDGSISILFGKECFCDKRIFWVHHNTWLISFCSKVCEKGIPIEVFDKKIKCNNKI
ncbi:MAG: hypothetical protein ACI86M_000930 [Saprospiraceae bacterium]|jgi:hypothetical protein